MTDVAASRMSARFGPLGVMAFVAAVLTAHNVLVMGSMPYWMVDFLVYREAGNAELHGHRLYDIAIHTPAFLAQYTQLLGWPPLADMQYIYTPFAALPFVPIALLTPLTAQAVWTFFNFLALGAVLWVSLGWAGVRASRQRRTLFVAGGMVVAPLLAPVQMNMLLGQINLFLLLLVMIDFMPGTPARLRGIGIGIAAGIKLTPMIFVVYLFLTGRPRAAFRAIGVFFATILIGAVAAPDDSRLYWLDGLFFDSTRMVPGNMLVNHSLPSFFARLAGGSTPPSWSLLVSGTVGAACVVAAVWARRCGQDMVGVLVIGFAAQVISPITWVHHSVWVVPAFVWLAAASWRTATVLPKALIALGLAWYTMPFWLLGQQVSDGLPYQLTPAGNAFVTLTGNLVPAVLAIAFMPVWLKRLRSTRVETTVPAATPMIATT
jgi:alpha-1,2-mannosyltransferase